MPTEKVNFDYQKFLDELTSQPATIQAPESGTMLKYFAGDEEPVPIRLGGKNGGNSGKGDILKRAIGLFLAGLLCGSLAIWYFMPGNSSRESQNANTTTEATNDERNSYTENDVAGNTVDTGCPGSNNPDGISINQPGDNQPEAGDTKPQATLSNQATGKGVEASGS